MLLRLVIAALFIGSATGCASVLKDKTQPVKVETLDSAGKPVAGAKCVLQNDRGAFNVESPNTVFVRKSEGDLVISCNAPEQPQADGKLISRVGGAVFGNILLGGGIGAIVDSASGVAFNYPEWVQLVFGKSLTFDRKDFKDAQPTVAVSADAAESDSGANAATPVAPLTPASSTATVTHQPVAAESVSKPVMGN